MEKRRSKLRSDVKEFLKNGKWNGIILLISVLCIILIAFGDGGNDEKTSTAADDELSEVCSMIEGVGECRVMMTYKDGEVFAVAVICEGADDPETEMRLVELITSLYGIGSNRVSVKPLSKKE